jgi:hypothetical protein
MAVTIASNLSSDMVTPPTTVCDTTPLVAPPPILEVDGCLVSTGLKLFRREDALFGRLD